MQLSNVISILIALSSAAASPLATDTAVKLAPGPMKVVDFAEAIPADHTNVGPLKRATLVPRVNQPGAKNDTQWVLSLINSYDRKYGITPRKWSTQLHNNDYKTVQAGQGKNQVHALYDGSYAQVLSPGRYDNNPSTGPFGPFELVYLAWLCERPNDSQLNGVCKQAASYSHIDSSGGTGHHDILVNPSYKTIGCAFYANVDGVPANEAIQGIWGCDLGF